MATASFDGNVPRHGGGAGSGPLGVHGASRKIGKPGAGQQDRKPVIIYVVSPKVIHVEAHEFMALVQRLTGPDAGRGDKKSRPSTPGGASSPARPEPEGARNKGAGTRAAPPVRVTACALNRPAGSAVSVSVTATRQQAAGPSAAAAASPSGFMFHDLSPLRGGALKGEHPLMVSPGWLHHVSDHFLSPGTSPSAGFLDIFGPLSTSSQQQ
ncbi:protein MKS1-like [Phragmites australis]|uniref:protein MKS1-like n=1 Tax=Phragmites australis TaxID=29695 RepID=UPI002D78B2E7|nr:protein MKS1-like [Phragmites australis]